MTSLPFEATKKYTFLHYKRLISQNDFTRFLPFELIYNYETGQINLRYPSVDIIIERDFKDEIQTFFYEYQRSLLLDSLSTNYCHAEEILLIQQHFS